MQQWRREWCKSINWEATQDAEKSIAEHSKKRCSRARLLFPA
jgi:hypothetical protein